jgi:hypothetical protein
VRAGRSAKSEARGRAHAWRSICGWKMPDSKLNLTVGKLTPVFNDRDRADLRRLIDDFACLVASRVERQRIYLESCARGIRSARSRGRTSMLELQVRSMPTFANIRSSNYSTGNRGVCFVPAVHRLEVNQRYRQAVTDCGPTRHDATTGRC